MCPTCNNSNGPRVIGGISQILASINTPCTSALCPSPQDSKCTFYTAGDLACSGIKSKDSIEVALQKIDTLLCASAANYSTYNTFCLSPIDTQQEFVEAISQFVCTTESNLNTFTGTTFPAYQAAVTAALAPLQVPGIGITCSGLTIATTDTLQSVLGKMATSVCNLFSTQLNLSSINWNQCFTVSPIPTTLQQAFNVVLAQICQVATASGVTLPAFNNVGSCLPSPGSTDTLVDTINKIKTRLCQSPTFDINALSWNCITKPNTTTLDLQSSVQAILTKIDSISQNMPTFSSDFSATATNPSAPCAGKTISLSSSIADRKVAATSTDNTPGTLQDKLVQGTGVTLDYTDSTKVVISATASGGPGDGKVKTDIADVANYLDVKIAAGGVTNGVQVVPALDTSNANHQINLNVSVDPVALFTAILNSLPANPDLKAALCAAIATCPSPCSAPSNVSIIYGGTTSSTTTTTTTPAPTTTTTTTTTLTPPTTTTTSSTTTTTTTVALDDIFVFAQATTATPSAATILAGNHTTQNASLDVSADWTPFSGTPQVCVVAIHQRSGTVKTKWFEDVINNGNIGGGGDLFSAPVTVTAGGNPYDVYITAFATTFDNVVLMKA